MSEFFKILAQSEKANQYALDMEGRTSALQFAIVTNVDDPLKLRRIRCTTESKGGLTETDWLMPVKVLPYFDPPIPPVGSSVLIGFIDNDPHDGIFFGSTINRTNPEDKDQESPLNDNTQTIPGNSKEEIGGWFEETIKGYLKQTVEKYAEVLIKDYLDHTVEKDEDRRTDENLTVDVGKTITIQNDAGAFIKLTELGAVIISDAFGNRLVLGGSSATEAGATSDFMWDTVSGNCNWNLGGNAIQLTNASGVAISGKQVATLGAVSTDGSVLVNKGWT